MDILSFGEIADNHGTLEEFISKVNIDNNSHLYEVTPYESFMDILMPNAGVMDMDDFGDIELRRALEESRRTYQMVMLSLFVHV